MTERLKLPAKVTFALLIGLLFNEFAAPRWSSWNQTFPAMALTMGVCFLAGLSLAGMFRGPGALSSAIAFALSFLVWPGLRYGTRVYLGNAVGYFGFLGILEALPAIAGGVAGLNLRRFKLRIMWFGADAILAICLLLAGAPR